MTLLNFGLTLYSSTDNITLAMIKSEYKNIYNNEDTHFIYVSMHKTIIQLLKTYKNTKLKLKILDAGCGTGLLLKKLERFGQVHGIDISSEAIKFAKKRNLKNLKVSSVTKLPFKSNTFDVVTCIDVLYHQEVENDIIALKEFQRVLKPNGILILKVPAYNWLRSKHDSIAHTARRFTNNEIKEKISKAGLKIKKSTYANFFIFPLVLIKRFMGILNTEKPKSDLVKLNPILNKVLIGINQIEDKIIEKINLPFGLTIFSVALNTNKGNSKKTLKH